MIYNRNVIEEAVRLIQIDETPSFYKRLRRWARKNIKKETVAPIDLISWPKGCLAVGFMHQANKLMNSDTPEGKALSILCFAEVEDFINRWIDNGCSLYTIDDCLLGQALISLYEFYASYGEKENEGKKLRYLNALDTFMNFLKAHDTDIEGSFPYRPAHKNGRIFADGIGMAAPFAIQYGVIKNDDEAIEIGMRQIKNFAKYGIDEKTGLPYHAYSIDGNSYPTHFGAVGWGRAVGWILYGIEASAQYLQRPGLSFIAVRALNELREIKETMLNSVTNYERENGLYGSQLLDNESPIDTSATSMILYAMNDNNDASQGLEKNSKFDLIKPFVSDDGQVTQAQSECMDLGVYGETYASYPWSVGMALLLD